MEPGFEYVVTQWAIWRAGGIAVPLCPDHPEREIEYVIDDADCAALVGAGETGRRVAGPARERGIPFHDAADTDSAPLRVRRARLRFAAAGPARVDPR